MIEKIPFDRVEISGGFWKKRQELVRRVTIRAVYDRFCDTGRLEAFRFSWREGEKNRPHIFWDSDVAKWIESAAYLIQKGPEPELERIVDGLVEEIETHQWPDGYFNIYFTVCEPQSRFQRRTDHELYCAGHLIEAAVAYYQATGKDRFLRCMCRYADLIERVFMKERSAAFVTPGHEEIELALVRLYEATGEARYLALSKFFIDMRGCCEEDEYEFAGHSYSQSHLPVREQKTAEGHAVRAGYLYSGMADIARMCGDAELKDACEALFRNITERRMYITGATGSSAVGEAFTIDYDLPNLTAYAESCASIALAFFSERMQRLENDARYADVIERILYNGLLSSISLDGKSFFYENPLEINPRLIGRDSSIRRGGSRYPITQRLEVFDCSCCPPNITRFIASLGGLLYTADEERICCHQFMESAAAFEHNGKPVRIVQETDYPRSGAVRIRYFGERTRLAVRIPPWCRPAYPGALDRGYAVFKVVDGSEISLSFDMRPRIVEAHPMVSENAGRVAVMRGPVVYCMEGVDNGANLRAVRLAADPGFAEEYDETFGTVLYARAFRAAAADENALYGETPARREAFTARLIPYHTFANRGETEMLVWMMRE
ncbi:MAG: hypothetical protein DBY36_06145 [Clostridiales bacterium]|nr:MAG: hypothetical protein DBY36_06145 [Clostridiales bacterium]